LEEVNASKSAEENIKKLCFSRGGILVEEFGQIFSDVFLRKSDYYEKILRILCDAPKEISEIQKSLNLESSGRTSEYLSELELSGFVSQDFTWKIKSGEDSKLRKYRIKDNYIRFYLKYIEKNLSKVHRNGYPFKEISLLPDWNSIFGLQFENLIINNRAAIKKALSLDVSDIISDNPYFQRATQAQKGCQIDYLIQTRFGTLYVCEIKFSKSPIGCSVIEEVQQKIEALSVPKGYSFRPILIHVNGISGDLRDAHYFSDILSMEDLSQ
jgi:hypothetical protein